ncbi:hypothetical protein MMC13_002452 [Lambiella insularis]|nr:hypothetical protein [Lambiella insularis]
MSSNSTFISHPLPSPTITTSHILLKVSTLDSLVVDLSVQSSSKRSGITSPPLPATSLARLNMEDEQALRPISPLTPNPPGFALPPLQKGEAKGKLFSKTFRSLVPRYRTIVIPSEVSGTFILQLPLCMLSPFRNKAPPTKATPQSYLFHHSASHQHHVKLVNSNIQDRAPPEYVGKARSQRIRMRRERPDIDRDALQGLQNFRFSDVIGDDLTPLASSGLSSTGGPEAEQTMLSAAAALARETERDTFLATVANLSQGGSIKKGKPWIHLGEESGHVLQIVAVERSDRLCTKCREERQKWRSKLWNSHVERDNGLNLHDNIPLIRDTTPFNISVLGGSSKPLTAPVGGPKLAEDSVSNTASSTIASATEGDDLTSRPELKRADLTWQANGYYERKRPKLIYCNGKWIHTDPDPDEVPT